MTGPRLTQDATSCLAELGRISAGCPYATEHYTLARHGLIDINKGRFGAYARITEAGRKHLARTVSQQVVGPPAKPRGPGGTRGVSNPYPEAATGAAAEAPSARSTSLRGAVPRPSRITAKQAKPHGQKRR